MKIFKCKMCGGALQVEENQSVCECEYCGTKQTLPDLTDEKRANLYDRANHFRRSNEFDKAMGIYEQILNEDNNDAEAYWSIVLCRYGIEYVEDPVSHKRIPTVNRAQYTSIFDDEDYKSAIEHANLMQKTVYEEEAKTINEIQKGILEISQKEDPFDVFICYKETDTEGRRTRDSVLANDLYHQLKLEGMKVFFARITLEDKLGTAYEPYIFAALNSARVMVVIGTKPEYFNAVWVKNEWSRYLALVKKSKGKKMLIPAYRDMDPYHLPDEFSHLQAQDMSKLGFMQDLIRGIKKIANAEEQKETIRETVVMSEGANVNIEPLLKRVALFLEDADFHSADEYCEKVLDIEPECAEAYLGKLMAELKVRFRDELKNCEESFDEYNNYQKAYRFGSDELKEKLHACIKYINDRNENTRKKNIYNHALEVMKNAKNEEECQKAAKEFESITGYEDADTLLEKCYEKAAEARKKSIYDDALERMQKATSEAQYNNVAELFQSITEYKNAEELVNKCYEKAKIAKEEEKNRGKDDILMDGIALKNADTIQSNMMAIEKFKEVHGWKNADELIQKCRERIAELRELEEKTCKEEMKTLKRIKRIRRKENIKLALILIAAAACVIGVFGFIKRDDQLEAIKATAIGKTFSDSDKRGGDSTDTYYERTIVKILDAKNLKLVRGRYLPVSNKGSDKWKRIAVDKSEKTEYSFSVSLLGNTSITIDDEEYTVVLDSDNTIKGIEFYEN